MSPLSPPVLGKMDRQHVYALAMHNGRYGRFHISQKFDEKMDVDILSSMLKPGDNVYAEIGSIKALSPALEVYNITVRTPKIHMTAN